MLTYNFLSFKMSVLDNNVVEFVVFDDAEFDIEMVNQFHEVIENNMHSPALVLVNKMHSYSYTFEALVALSRSKSIKSVAVLSNKNVVSSLVSYLAKRFNVYKVPVKTFHERERALQWLRSVEYQEVLAQQHV